MSFTTPTPDLISPPEVTVSPPTPSPPTMADLNLPSPDLSPEISVSPSPVTSPMVVEPPPVPIQEVVEAEIPFFGPSSSKKVSFLGNIKNTIKKYKVINLAIGIIIASFLSEGVYFLVDDIIMKNSFPLIKELVGEKSHINLGLFRLNLKQVLRTTIRTVVFTLVLFIIIKLSEHLELL